jgi:hypothetical protein
MGQYTGQYTGQHKEQHRDQHKEHDMESHREEYKEHDMESHREEYKYTHSKDNILDRRYITNKNACGHVQESPRKSATRFEMQKTPSPGVESRSSHSRSMTTLDPISK